MNDDAKKPVPDPTGHDGSVNGDPTPVIDTTPPKSNLSPDEVGVRPPDRIEGKDVPGTENTALIFERS